MKRHVLNLVIALSLILCVTVTVLWVRSAWTNDWFYYNVLNAPAGRWTGYTLVSQHAPSTRVPELCSQEVRRRRGGSIRVGPPADTTYDCAAGAASADTVR